MGVAVVTGASRGIGRATALKLSATHQIVAAARNAAELATLAREIEGLGGRCRTIPIDLTDGGAVAEAFAGIEADVLVNNAGVGIIKPFLDLSPEEWHRMIDLNVNALFHVTRALLPAMVGRGSGHVVFIGSIAGRSAFAGGVGYTATKWAVMGMSESLLFEIRDRGVKVTVVNPGSVATHFSERSDSTLSLSADEVADAVAYVVSTPSDVLVHRLEIRPLVAPKKQ